jgi:hypothetical protein
LSVLQETNNSKGKAPAISLGIQATDVNLSSQQVHIYYVGQTWGKSKENSNQAWARLVASSHLGKVTIFANMPVHQVEGEAYAAGMELTKNTTLKRTK